MINIPIRETIELVKIFAQGIGKFISVLFIYKKLQLIILLLLIISLIFLGYRYTYLNEQYQRIVVNTLYQESESTPQRFKGVESFILSYLDKSIDSKLKTSNFSESFLDAFQRVQDSITNFHFNNKSKIALDIVSRKNPDILTDITDTLNNKGFLFLPINILRNNLTIHQKKDVLTKKNNNDPEKRELIGEIEKDTILMHDISFAQNLNELLQDFTAIPITEHTVASLKDNPEQVYLITKSGINYIFSYSYPDFTSAEKYYGNQFTSTTFFPSRPYFWSAFIEKRFASTVNEIKPEAKSLVGEYFYVSKPYMDLAGNGFIVTLSRGILLDGKIVAALCFDLPLTQGNSKTKKTTIQEVLDDIRKDIDVDDQEIITANVTTSGSLEIDDKSPLATDFRDHIRKLSSNERSIAIGNIQVFGDYSKESLKISIPVGNTKYPQVNFLLFQINMSKFQNKIFYTAFLFLIIISILIAYLGYLYATTVKRSEEYGLAFNQIDGVMQKSPIPYCRLDANDYIKDVNPAFCIELEYDPKSVDSYTLLKQKTFSSLCADNDSRNLYQKVEISRRENEIVKPYLLELLSATGMRKKFIIVSGQYPSSLKGNLPETFGILLEANDLKYKRFIEEFVEFKFNT